METENIVEKLATQLAHNASVKNVYGDPVVTEDKTIIPVAQVAFGFGGGFGHKKNPKPAAEDPENIQTEKIPRGEGGGGGGGVRIKAVGVYEVTKDKTTFIPASINKELIIAAVIGFVIRGFFSRRKK